MSEKKVAFITGANRGLGRETAKQLGKLGITVVLGSRDARKGEEAASALRSEGIDAESLRCDVINPQDHLAAYKYLDGKFGKLDILINNAGVHLESEDGDPGWVKTDMGGPNAQMEIADGGKTSTQLATLPANGPTGGFFHLGDTLPW